MAGNISAFQLSTWLLLRACRSQSSAGDTGKETGARVTRNTVLLHLKASRAEFTLQPAYYVPADSAWCGCVCGEQV
jgi:hypothetical protein